MDYIYTQIPTFRGFCVWDIVRKKIVPGTTNCTNPYLCPEGGGGDRVETGLGSD